MNITIPSTGLRGKSLVALLCAVIILAVFGGLAGIFIASLQEHPSPFSSIVAIVLATIAGVVPISLLLYSLQVARRRVTCSLSQTGLDIEWHGPIHSSRKHFASNEVRGFGATQSTSPADGQLLDALVLYLQSDEHELLSQKAPSSLGALAQQLTDACALLHRAPDSGLAKQFPIPPSARVQLIEADSSTTLFFPPRGLRGGLFVGAILALSFIFLGLLGAAAFIINMFVDLKLGKIQPGSCVVAILEFAIGPVGLATVFHESRRRMVLILTPGGLVFRSQGPFRTRESSWPRRGLRAAAVTAATKDAAHHFIRLSTPDAKPQLLMERPDLAELEWVATVINHWSGELPPSNESP